MRKNSLIKKIQIGTLATAMLLSLAACGDKSSDSSHSNEMREIESYVTTEAPAETEAYYNGAYESEEYYMGDYAYEDEGVSLKSAGAASGSGENPNIADVSQLSKIDTEKLVYRCSLSFETLNYNESVIKLRNLINSYNGFMENEDVNTYIRDGKTYYNYSATIRVPSASYESFVNGTADVGDLKNKSQNVENLSQEYGDISAELEVLETKRESYLEMMKEAKKLEDMENLLMIDDRITDVEIQINRIKTRLNRIDNDVAYSYVNVNISEVEKYEEPVAETFGERLSRGLKNGWENFTEGVQNFMVDVTENLPKIIITITVILLVWFLVIRRFLRYVGVPSLKQMKANRKARKAMQAQQIQNYTVQQQVQPQTQPQAPVNTQAESQPQAEPQAPADNNK
ncbi:MAG: DUF4349 domain-containing protein [Lachnospiraceae bacterium]|nr:DUF4349 domain-containing protein [Lachnospiraceae bacterium]